MKFTSPFKTSKAGVGLKPFVRKKTPLRTRPAKPPIAIPRIILSQLQGLSARVLQITWTEGFLWLGTAVCGILLVQATLDWLFDLAWHIRFLFALCDLGLLGWLVYRYILKPWSKQLTPEEAALRAEVRFPALRTSLISAVQLAKSPEGSTRMVEILIQQVAKRAAQMNFASAVSAKHLKKLSLVTMALLALTAGLTAWLMPKSIVLIERIFLFRVPLPTQTIVIPVSTDFSVPAGENIEISAKAQGVIPRTGTVEISYEGQGSQTVSISPTASDPDTFTLALQNVQQGLTYRFRLNDGRGDEYKVVILHGPVIQKISFEQNYPAYTNLAKTQLTAGNLTLLAGSRLHIEAKADQELKTAHIQLKGVDQQIPMTIASDNKSISGDISIPAQGLEGFSIVMENTNGIPSPNNTLYRVEVVPDKPPEITYDAGQPEDRTFVEADRPELRFKVIDDFQVRKVFLCVEKVEEAVAGSDEGATPEAAPGPEQVTRIPIDVPTPAAALNFNYIWQTAGTSAFWKEGTSISYWIEAEDNNNVTGPGIGKSGKRQWRVISTAEMQKELRDKEKEVAEKMDEDAKKQDELRQSLGNDINKEAAPK